MSIERCSVDVASCWSLKPITIMFMWVFVFTESRLWGNRKCIVFKSARNRQDAGEFLISMHRRLLAGWQFNDFALPPTTKATAQCTNKQQFWGLLWANECAINHVASVSLHGCSEHVRRSPCIYGVINIHTQTTSIQSLAVSAVGRNSFQI